jgi:hypothetical protein
MERRGKRKRGFDLEQRRQRVFEAWCNGKTQRDIAAAENVHRSQICRDLDAVLAELHQHNLDDRDSLRLAFLGKLIWQEAELMAAWQRSKKQRQRRRAKRINVGSPKQREESERIEEDREGDPRYMDLLLKNWEMQGKVLMLSKDEDLPRPPAAPGAKVDVFVRIEELAARLTAATGGPGNDSLKQLLDHPQSDRPPEAGAPAA